MGGPTKEEFESRAQDSKLHFKIVAATPALVPVLNQTEPPAIPSLAPFTTANRIGVDDVLQIIVFETGAGLFSPGVTPNGSATPGTAIPATLPPVTVGADGDVTLPYLGRVHAAGQTAEELRDQIQKMLKGRASQPQVVVNIMTNVWNTVIVSGDVHTPGRYPLTQSPEKLLDAIALAGGGLHLPFDTTVVLTRGTTEERAVLGAIGSYSAQNPTLRAGDRVYVAYDPRSYTVYGATPAPQETTFNTEQVTLAQAIARNSGMNDEKADATGVYLFRFESAKVMTKLGMPTRAAEVPVVYSIDLGDPASFFVIQRLQMRNHDIIYISYSQAAQLRKFLGLLSAIFSPLGTAGAASNLAR